MTDYQIIAAAIEYLDKHFQAQPTLAELAAHVGMSEFHLQRTFKRWAGISPKRFLQYLTAEHARARLQENDNVLNTAYDAGLSGGGRLHDLMVTLHAMTPGEIKQQGAGLLIRYGVAPTPFGDALLGLTPRGICELHFVDERNHLDLLGEMQQRWAQAEFVEDVPAVRQKLAAIFAPTETGRPVTLLVKGSNFQVKVWEALLRIPSGAVVTYQQVAQAIEAPTAARAVGSAVGSNPVAYLIPCHRVIRKRGIIDAYRWGHVRKKSLLAWEAAHLEQAELPALHP